MASKEEKYIELGDDYHPMIVEYYLKLLYCRQLSPGISREGLVALYCFGERLIHREFQNEEMMKLICDFLSKLLYLSAGMIDFIYENTTMGSPIRRFLPNCFAWHCYTGGTLIWENSVRNVTSREFLEDVVLALMYDREAREEQEP